MSGMNLRAPSWLDIGLMVMSKIGLRKHDRMIARSPQIKCSCRGETHDWNCKKVI